MGQGVANALAAPCPWGLWLLDRALALAIKVRTRPGTPSTFGGWEELPRGAVEEEEEEMDAAENNDANQVKD